MQSAQEVCNHLLLETGFNAFLIKSPTGAMPPAMPNNGSARKEPPPFANLLDNGRAMLGQTITGDGQTPYVLPTLQQMIRIGETLQTRYVLAGRAQWSTRNVWVGVANRAKSLCTVDMLILDMRNRSLVLNAHNIEGDSTENKSMFSTVSSAISLNPLPLVLAGSVTPQEQRAVAIAATKAIEPWLRQQRIQAALAQADLSSMGGAEAASTDNAAGKFSALLNPLTEIQATLHVSDVDQKECASLDSEPTRLYALSTLHLDYKEPNHLHLRGTGSQGEPTTLLVEEDTRRFTVGEHGKSSVQDLTNAPTRRLSLLDFCGLLTPGMFDFMRARFVRQEKLGELQTVVYDLSYWRGDDISYQRLWIDLNTHLAIKREVYNHSSKLRAVYLYQQPANLTPNTWLPGRLEIQNASRKRIALFTITDAKINTINKSIL